MLITATYDQHLAKVQAAERVLGTLSPDNPDHHDWVVTLVFYAALRYVSAYLAVKQVYPQSHDERLYWVHTEARLRRIGGHYERLYNQSLLARYGYKRWPVPQLAALAQDLSAIREQVFRHLVVDLL